MRIIKRAGVMEDKEARAAIKEDTSTGRVSQHDKEPPPLLFIRDTLTGRAALVLYSTTTLQFQLIFTEGSSGDALFTF